ncbi:MAG: hypothetical protein AAFP13_01590 [Pseudomonadota bacterium]
MLKTTRAAIVIEVEDPLDMRGVPLPDGEQKDGLKAASAPERGRVRQTDWPPRAPMPSYIERASRRGAITGIRRRPRSRPACAAESSGFACIAGRNGDILTSVFQCLNGRRSEGGFSKDIGA